MKTRSALTRIDVLIGVVILLAIIIGTVAVLRIDSWGRQHRREEPDRIDPALIHYEQTGEIPVRMQQVRAVAVGPDDRIYVAGDKAIHVLDSGGSKRSEIALENEPKCLAVGGAKHALPGRVYVGMEDHVEVFDATGRPQGTWETLGEKALLTSIAVAGQDVFAADAGNRIVWHFDTAGRQKGRIGAADEDRKHPGFLITGEHFDLAVAPDGLLRVVNPRALRIEAYTFDGDLDAALSWKKSSPTIEGFYGCCNPAHFAILADGRFVTAEKGRPRVKIYGAKGEFVCVVAGPEQVPHTAADVAADSRDRILILDPKTGSVRVFEHKEIESGAER